MSLELIEAADQISDTSKTHRKYLLKADSIIKILPTDSLSLKLEFKVASRFYNTNLMEDFLKSSERAVKKSIELKDSLNLAKSYLFIGDYYSKGLIIDKAYNYYFKSEQIYRKLKDSENTSALLLNRAVLHLNESDYVGAEKATINALKFLRGSNNSELKYNAFNLLGIINQNLGETETSLSSHNSALNIAKKQLSEESPFLKFTSLNNIGFVLQKNKRNTEAKKFFLKILAFPNLEIDARELYLSVIFNLANTDSELGNYINSEKLLLKNLNEHKSSDDKLGMLAASLALSEIYDIMKNVSLAKKYASDSKSLANSIKSPQFNVKALKQLIKVDRANASKYAEEYIRISDSLQVAERRIRNKLARIEYETDELIVEKNSLIEQRKSIIYITLALLTIGAFVFIIRIQMAKNRELILIQQQQKANEEIYELMLSQQSKMEAVRQTEKRNIARELHDGVLGKLFGTRLNLGLLNEKNTEKAAEERVQFIEELKKIEQEIREISHDLSQEKAAVVNNFVLVLNDYFEKQKLIASASITLDITDNIKWQEIDNLTKINLYRIVQECLQNINKHAQATEAHFNITQLENQLHLQVIDNGIGFNANKEKKGIGLKNIDLRVKQSKASMEIYSEKNRGTTFLFKFPLTSYA
ncbi:tetratricopeptide repeat-containing sensor histidine kinase [Flavobacterium aurantiibacter]|nr:ATP-binding protein [Flavobacterium aurantiibacter]